ncbi:unnamed protein product, partial [Hymenolepis diminuta]
IFTQVNFSTSTEDPKDYEKSHGELNIIIFIRTAWRISLTPLVSPCCFVNLTEVTTTYVRSTSNRWVLFI